MKKSFKINSRHEALKALIAQHPVDNQQKLVKLLKQEYNIEANQAIISRDLRDLRITKKLLNGKLVYENSNVDVTQEILNASIIDIVYNEGISKEGEIIVLGEKYGLITKEKNSYFYNNEKIGVGYESAREYLRKNETAKSELIIKIIETYKKENTC